MPAHRKPKKRPRPSLATLALAGATTAATAATASGGAAQAEPRQTPAQVKTEVDGLYRQAEAATQQYNGTKADVDATRSSLNSLRDEAARTTDRLNTARGALGAIASAQYRSGGLAPAMRLALSGDPETFLEDASIAERAGSRNAQAVQRVSDALTHLRRLRTQADGRLATLTAQQERLARQKAEVNGKLADAKRLLARLSAQQRARYEAGGYADGQGDTTTPAPNARAAAAVAYARGALGRPYVWGATGPDAFDCSGLTQAAWKAAGVSLPRTTYTQIGAGRRVQKSQLQPGDLVFFYSGVSHVGLYIGHGEMIHAPHPGAPVRVAPIDEMPFAGATRPA
ncbi:C40 family peptidase [Streptomyces montanisoli]|uniref:C40 family peptidase n=1 Tax=Streptomyces montanisoli TaxID=2798581 RepID=A0A940MFJ5_9ACTN|nr:NlpC/P60 family protein [Streptomyces montanisoli]MBP0459080.1 C40 family peptidase [Streptomyces montanisoli]